ncbi:MAG: hypothetical protein RLZZ155_456 [Bacteroidota bacterium]|jgi:uncharacterized protein (TIGR01777 family)
MNVLVTGGTGFIGKQIIYALLEKGHSVTNLTTQRKQEGIVSEKFQHVYWNPTSKEINKSLLSHIEGVIHLAGYSVANKWSAANKALMVSSRISSTEFLCELLNEMDVPPAVIVGASASGFYKNSHEIQDETAAVGTGFLADLTAQWENASASLHPSIKNIHLRIGVVLSANDGALKKLTPIFKAGIGSAVGDGQQYMSWVHENDLVRLFIHCLENSVESGIYNATSDTPVTNFEFSKCLAQVLHRPFFLPKVPSFVLRILFGEMSQLVLVSQRLSNKKTRDTAFEFQYKNITPALEALYGKAKG